MRIRVLSDLHLEFGNIRLPHTEADVLVLAGDIWLRDRGVHWAKHLCSPERVIYVPGNHEFYKSEYYATVGRLRMACAATGMRFGHRDEFVIDGVRFLCATLWTDFELYGADHREAAMREAEDEMNDFKLITLSAAYQARRLRADDVLEMHEADREFLETRLNTPFVGRTVVVTHYLPSARSIDERYGTSLLNASYASSLDRMIERTRPTLWIHGHTHDSFDYSIGSTRIICNPRGYTPDELNPKFDPTLIVEV
jgi:Icc-related predicted phosphoesterase